MSKPIVIFGIGSVGDMAYKILTDEKQGNVVAFVVDVPFDNSSLHFDLPIYNWNILNNIYPPSACEVFVAIGYKSILKKKFIYEEFVKQGYELINIISNKAILFGDINLGRNNIVMPGAVIEHKVTIGSNNIFWSSTNICHDSVIGDHNFFATNSVVGGYAQIGNCNFIGFSSVILQTRKVCNDTLIGANSLINRDLISSSVYYGSPARKIDDLDPLKGVSIIDK